MPTTNDYRYLALKQLATLNHSEKQLTTFLKVMENKASSSMVKVLIDENMQNTITRIRCLEEILYHEPVTFSTVSIEGINGIIKEGFDLLEKETDPILVDATLLHILLLITYYKLGSYQAILLYLTPAEFKQEFKLMDQAFKLEEYSLQEISDLLVSHYSNHTNLPVRKINIAPPEKLIDLFF